MHVVSVKWVTGQIGPKPNRPKVKSAPSQIGPKSKRPQVKSTPVKSTPSQIGPHFCHKSLNTIQQIKYIQYVLIIEELKLSSNVCQVLGCWFSYVQLI